MIDLYIEIEDTDGIFGVKELLIPCNLSAELDDRLEYLITGSTPFVPDIQSMDIQKLNRILEDINSENPGMTAEFLLMLMEASGRDLRDTGFVRRVLENDFLFEDLSEIPWSMSDEELAACYLASELQIPFDADVTEDFLQLISEEDALIDYINWELVWEQYRMMGFTLAKGQAPEDDSLYLIHFAV